MKPRSLSVALLGLFGLFAGVLPSCGGSSDATFSSGIPAGAERGACRADGNCDTGLECRSNLCVSSGGSQSSGGTSNNAGGSSTSKAGDSSSSGGIAAGSGGANASGGMNASGAGVGQAGSSAAGDAAGGAGGAGGADVQCDGSHPLVSEKNRYCDVGACYCSDPFDTCFSKETAAACCQSAPRCGNEIKDRGVNCAGQHPVIGPPRTCTPGNCFCSDGATAKWDVCLPKAVAASCCPPGVTLTCVE